MTYAAPPATYVASGFYEQVPVTYAAPTVYEQAPVAAAPTVCEQAPVMYERAPVAYAAPQATYAAPRVYEHAGVTYAAPTVSEQATLPCSSRRRMVSAALQRFETMKSQELTPNVIAYNLVISACANGVPADTALQLFETMRAQELTPNVIAYNSVCLRRGVCGWELGMDTLWWCFGPACLHKSFTRFTS